MLSLWQAGVAGLPQDSENNGCDHKNGDPAESPPNPNNCRTGRHPHDTATDTFMRRRRRYGWQTRALTQEELRAHVASRLRGWRGRPEISDAFR
jgi:hypothetical protein